MVLEQEKLYQIAVRMKRLHLLQQFYDELQYDEEDEKEEEAEVMALKRQAEAKEKAPDLEIEMADFEGGTSQRQLIQ